MNPVKRILLNRKMKKNEPINTASNIIFKFICIPDLSIKKEGSFTKSKNKKRDQYKKTGLGFISVE